MEENHFCKQRGITDLNKKMKITTTKNDSLFRIVESNNNTDCIYNKS